MVLVSYSHRIIVDYEFIKWVSKSEHKSSIISRLLRINQNSREHKKRNVIITEQDFKKLCDEGIIKDKDTIRGCFFPLNVNEELGDYINGELSEEFMRLILGVALTSEKPFQVILLTTRDNRDKYIEKYNAFLEKIKNFSVKEEQESTVILNDLYKSYSLERGNR